MSKISFTPNASGTGTFTIASPNSNTSRTLTLPDASGELLTTTGVAGTTKAWCDWSAWYGSINNSGNISSISDFGTGYWGVNFSSSFASSTYNFTSSSVVATDGTGGVIGSDMGYNSTLVNKSTSSMRHRMTRAGTPNYVDFFNASTQYTE